MTDIAPAKKKHVCSTIVQRAPANAGDARITISTADEDREGDILVPEGAILTNYERNPVVLFGHDSRSLPIARAVHLSVQAGKGIQADFKWLQNDPFADRVRNAFEQGVLNAASVGFIPKKWEPHGQRGYRYTSWELYEFSLVPIGANPNALRTLKHFGLDSPAPVARANVLLDELLTQVRSGVVLSHGNEDRLEKASEILAHVLSHINDADDADDADEPGDKAVVFDGTPITLSEAALDTAIRRVVDAEIAKATGQVNEEPLLIARSGDQPVIEMSDDDLAELIARAMEQAISEGFNRVTGRID